VVSFLGNFKFISQVLIVLSALGVVFGVIGAFSADVWLASTQWLLIAAVLAVFSVYLRLEE
jgi:hypothetical protein